MWIACQPPGTAWPKHENADDGADNIEAHLHDVCPDDGGHSALESVDQGERANDRDRQDIISADCNADDDRDGEDPHSFRRRAQEEKRECRELMETWAEALSDDFICSEQLAAEVARQEKEAHHDTAKKVAKNDLEETPVAGKGKPWNADDRKCAGFRGNDGEGDSPPGNLAIGKEISFKRTAFASKAQAKDGDCREVNADNQEIRCAQAMRGRHSCWAANYCASDGMPSSAGEGNL